MPARAAAEIACRQGCEVAASGGAAAFGGAVARAADIAAAALVELSESGRIGLQQPTACPCWRLRVCALSCADASNLSSNLPQFIQ